MGKKKKKTHQIRFENPIIRLTKLIFLSTHLFPSLLLFFLK